MGKVSYEVNRRYRTKTFDTFNIEVVKGQRDLLTEEAKARGISRNELVCAALSAYLGKNITCHVEDIDD